MVGVPQPDLDQRLAVGAPTHRRDHLRDLRPGDRALDQLEVLGDGERGSRGDQQAQKRDRRENPLQSEPILRPGD